MNGSASTKAMKLRDEEKLTPSRARNQDLDTIIDYKRYSGTGEKEPSSKLFKSGLKLSTVREKYAENGD